MEDIPIILSKYGETVTVTEVNDSNITHITIPNSVTTI